MKTALDLGWWQFAPTPEGGRMEHVHTGEAIVAGAPLSGTERELAEAAHPGRPELAWRRFHYEHGELHAVLAVGLGPDAGLTVVDYNLSARLSGAAMPAYGPWVRVDDAVLEAFRIWPSARTGDDPPGRLRTVGGWFNGEWEPRLGRSTIVFPPDVFLRAAALQYVSPEPDLDLPPLDLRSRRWVTDSEGRLVNQYQSDETAVASMVSLSLVSGETASVQLSDRVVTTPYEVKPETGEGEGVERVVATAHRLFPSKAGNPLKTGVWTEDKQDAARERLTHLERRVFYPSAEALAHDPDKELPLWRNIISPQASRRAWRECVVLFLVAPARNASEPKPVWPEATILPPIEKRTVELRHLLWIGSWFPNELARPDRQTKIEQLPPAYHDYHLHIGLFDKCLR